MTVLLIGLAVWALAIPAALALAVFVQHLRWRRRQAPHGAEILQFRPRGVRRG